MCGCGDVCGGTSVQRSSRWPHDNSSYRARPDAHEQPQHCQRPVCWFVIQLHLVTSTQRQQGTLDNAVRHTGLNPVRVVLPREAPAGAHAVSEGAVGMGTFGTVAALSDVRSDHLGAKGVCGGVREGRGHMGADDGAVEEMMPSGAGLHTHPLTLSIRNSSASPRSEPSCSHMSMRIYAHTLSHTGVIWSACSTVWRNMAND